MKKFDYHPNSRPSLPIDEGVIRGFLTPERKALIDNIEVSQSKIRLWGQGEFTLMMPAAPGQSLDRDKRSQWTPRAPGSTLISPRNKNLAFAQYLGLLGNEAKADIIAKDGSLFVGPFRAADLRPLF
ncbi:MAG: hypothetical protein IPF48_13660 [Sphingomonadales bacterium]|nr:hypothetical protein [Sphingomonadales bacterium]